MARVPFKTVDVFTTTPFQGNPVAVVMDASGLSPEQMQQIARWTNLSETTFVIPVTAQGADYHVRIFTPGAELPFAGHPTIGTAHALLEAGKVEARNGILVQQCKAGLIRLNVEQASDGNRWIHFDLPEPRIAALDGDQARELEAIIGSPLEPGRAPLLVDVGARWIIAQLPAAQAVLAVRPDLQRMKRQDIAGRHTGVVVFGEHAPGTHAGIEVRAFAPAHGIDEDPVCGSGNGCVAAYIRHTGQVSRFGSEFLATQGAAVGRAGTLRLAISGERIRVGGNAVTCVDGTLGL
ncbi:PhzF family phenazine biosynthesis protein [Noviherbaspirillum galbum]|uniref:PhzF family phenazine biosynthesis protein n=1 Tax=Noviherbaspirillum galbum TaxID=2709383 RepID=A0A6B3ST37_9BURK|nr:PhzF family phenazine biosynthesis protein [Noviherbaspirillum galbum]NEX63933.1 PhzF family phenazine biosynthesis protein [Noviherbaspirillum galbum]